MNSQLGANDSSWHLESIGLPDDESRKRYENATEIERLNARHVLWVTIWLGIVAAGGSCGVLIGLIGVANGALEMIFIGPFAGMALAGIAATFVMVHIGLIKWMFGLKCSPNFLALLCGGLAGLPSLIPPITMSLGAVGAIVAVRILLKSDVGKLLVVEEEMRKNPTVPRRRTWSLADLFARMTAVAVYIGIWLALLRL